MKDSLSALKERGFIYVPYPHSLRAAVQSAVESWKKFCQLPESEKSGFPYNPGEGMGVGYELKKAPKASHDLKEDFLFALGAKDWLRETSSRMNTPAVSEFVRQTESLLNTMKPTVINFAQQLQGQFSLPGLAQEVEDSHEIWYLRFLHYFGGRESGEEISTAHADKSGFTLHLYESDPGLQCFNFNRQWEDVPISSDQAMILPGMRMQYRSQNQLKATYHRVVATPEVAQNGRLSVVCFIHLKRTPEYDKTRAGRLQEFEPGFNYSMPFEEFEKLFKI